MVKKELKFGADVRASILCGVELVEEAVGVTLGPCGRNVAIQLPYGSPKVTKDGVTVANSITSVEDPYEDLGIQMLKEASNNVNQSSGDGTTTTTILAAAIYREGLKRVASGSNPIELKRGIDKAVKSIVEQLTFNSTVIETKDQIEQVGTISSNGDTEIGEIIADAMEQTGVNGTITVENGKGMDTTLTVVEGMEIVSPYLSPYFATNPNTLEAELDDPYILLMEDKITNIQDVLPLLQNVSTTGKPLLIIADSIDTEALSALITNKLRGTINVCACRAPSYGTNRDDIMKDIAILTGGTYISNDLGITPENIEPEQLGTCKRIVVSKDRTTIIEGFGDTNDIQDRVGELRMQISTCDNPAISNQLQLRLAKLDGGVGIIHVGAITESEVGEKKDRVDDAVQATKAAIEEGVVIGGGSALIQASSQLMEVPVVGDELDGLMIVQKAIESPLRMILANAGQESGLIVEKVKEFISDGDPVVTGFDAKNGVYANMMDQGIIDPTKVTRSAIQNAGSIAGLLLTLEVGVIEIPEENPPQMDQQQMMM